LNEFEYYTVEAVDSEYVPVLRKGWEVPFSSSLDSYSELALAEGNFFRTWADAASAIGRVLTGHGGFRYDEILEESAGDDPRVTNFK
jgi:hypothetical protein